MNRKQCSLIAAPYARVRAGLAGFTLVELLVSVAIFTVMVAMVMVVIQTGNTTYATADARIITQQDLRKALGVMFHELSETNRYRATIPSGDPSQIVFQIPIRVVDGGPLDGMTVDERNNIIFGARTQPTTVPDGVEDYAIQYLLVPNNDMSGSHMLVRRVLDAYPAGTQVGEDIVIANRIESLAFSKSGKTLSVAISATQQNSFIRNVNVAGNFGITMRN